MKKLQQFLSQPNALIASIILVLVISGTVLGTVYTPYDPLALSFDHRLEPPSADHLMGTDHFGRDVFSRLLAGANLSTCVSLMAVLVALCAGVPIGAVSGFFGGALDRGIMTVMDAFMSFPGLMLALGIMAVFGPSAYGVVFALGITYTPTVVRVMRSCIFSIRENEFVEASKAMGNNSFYTLTRHIVPNCVGPLTVLGTALFANALLNESALSFLGLGVPPPQATWGGVLAGSRQYISSAYWLGLFPGLTISITLLGINLFGDALRDYLDPRMRNL